MEAEIALLFFSSKANSHSLPATLNVLTANLHTQKTFTCTHTFTVMVNMRRKKNTWQRATSLLWISQYKILEEFSFIFPPVPMLYVWWYKQNWNKLFFEFLRNNVLCYSVGLKYPRSLSLAADDSFSNMKKREAKKEAEVKAGSVDSQSGISTYKIMLSSRGSEGEATSKWTQAGFTDSPACLKRMHNTMPKAWEKDCRKMFRVSSDTNQHEEAKYS